MKKYIASALFLLCIGCIDDPSETIVPNDGQQEFELLWSLFDDCYVGFYQKGTDWDYLYGLYYDGAAGVETRDEMVELELQLLAWLYDPRVRLIAPDGTVLPSYQNDVFVNCDSTVLLSYLEPDGFQWVQQGLWGFCLAGSDSVPYFVVKEWDSSFNVSLFDNVLQPLAQEPAMILDVRLASGSFDGASSNCARRFVSEQVIGHLTQQRLDASSHDLAEPVPVTLIPRGWNFEGQVVLLVGEGDGGTSEMFICDMSRIPSVVLMGDTTGGEGNWLCISRELPDGWFVTCPVTTLLSADTSFIEGLGVVPDILVDANESDFLNGFDPVLEAAFDYLGAQSPRVRR